MKQSKVTKVLFAGLLTACSVSLISMPAHAGRILIDPSKQIDKVMVKRGQAVTGTNRLLGEPLWDLGGELGDFGYNFLYGYNPNGDEPLSLTPDSPMNTLLASGSDPVFEAFLGVTPNDIDLDKANIPIRDIPMLVSPFGDRIGLPPVQDLLPGENGLAEPNQAITLGRWLQASGRMISICYTDGTSDVTVWFRRLMPHGLYTLWLSLNVDTDGNGQGDLLGGRPMGGVPNVIAADPSGGAVYQRHLDYCLQDDQEVKAITAIYHADGMVTGASPFVLPLIAGLTTQAAVGIPINAVPVE
ncbi:MAG: hypothetical protein Tsb002_26760 [Wenzhouxiangellaceae bacterium]